MRLGEWFSRLTAVLLLILTAPLLLLLWCLIKVSDPTQPAFFTQTRTGLNGAPFAIWKMRTMKHTDFTIGSPSLRDWRITRLGRFLRRWHIDELVQLVNIANGTMAFFGPRPLRPQALYEMSQHSRSWRQRHVVRPGLVGLAAVKQKGTGVCQKKKLAYDRLMIRHQSSSCFKVWLTMHGIKKLVLQ